MNGISPQIGDFTPLPPVTRHLSMGRNAPYPFEDMARTAQSNPGVSVLAATQVPLKKIKSVREYRGEPFKNESGEIRVAMRNSQVIDGIRHGDVYLTWIDTTMTEESTNVPPIKGHRSMDRNAPYPFEDMARKAQTRPGSTILAATKVPEGSIKSLRMYRGDPFIEENGYVRIEMRNSQVIDGMRHGDVYLTWIDTTPLLTSSD